MPRTAHYAPVSVCRFFLLRRASRPAVLQNIIDMRKRLKGAPTTGMVSVVVTDIEDFSGAVGGCNRYFEGAMAASY